MVMLSKAETVHRALPFDWHGEFTQDLVCISLIGGKITIPKGFITDGATIPRILWPILANTDPDILYASFIHDFLYAVHGKLPDRTLTKDQADNILREQMIVVGAPRWKADIVYRAVHIFGGFAYSKLVGIRRPWNAVTPPAKLARTPYAVKPQVRFP
jgi:hypothetical protein